MKMRMIWIIAALMAGQETVFAQSQPSGIVLTMDGLSKIYPPFDSSGWVLTRGSGIGTHLGDDYHAQDWSKSCFSEGSKLYAGISGSVLLNPADDGRQDSYGNTVVVVDYYRGFALRYAHLEGFVPSIRTGDLVLAGDYLGTVGATGNVQASEACRQQGGRGAHAHIVLYKNVPRISGRPLVQNINSGGPSSFSANFGYATALPLIKSSSSPAVFAVQNGARIPLTAFVFENHGWNFDRNRSIFDPLAGNVHQQSTIDEMPLMSWLLPPRSGSLVKGTSDQTVYLMQDGWRKGLTFDAFNCRRFSFAEVKTLEDWEIAGYPPNSRPPIALGCLDETKQALTDLVSSAYGDRRIGLAYLGTYGADFQWSSEWELRWMSFEFSGGRVIVLNHITSRADAQKRFTTFWDPDAHNWSGWIPVH